MNQLTPLNHLIAEARALGGENLCVNGHAWRSIGGRRCPNDWTDGCSQMVYECRTCGEVDYGEPGGPGALDCEGCRRGEY